ncbi:nuclease-related domain-containing protein [Marinobacter subterrani]|uniref:nuclease-related domain-containing protein n=1 Tax=Marinobacter subterrani TaxID=1658765 RepID=UPI002353E50A|nr:nuclease-related domain-containing protein [Marinobacter subterrani]
MDLSPVYQPLIAAVWYLLPLAIIAGLIKSPLFKGKFGEFLVNLSARWFLDKSRYHLIKNVTLATEDGTTQIDHVLISEFGVFAADKADARHVRALVAERYGAEPRRPSRGLLKVLIFPVLMLGVGAIGVNAYSNFVSGAMAIGTKRNAENRIKVAPQAVPRQSVGEPRTDSGAVARSPSSAGGVQRVNQPPSGLFLARQECNALIAAAIGNQDPRLLRDRDKACARYKVLQGEVL